MKLRQHCPLLFPLPNPTSPSMGLEHHFQSYCSTGCFLLNPTPTVLARQLSVSTSTGVMVPEPAKPARTVSKHKLKAPTDVPGH